LVTTNFDTFFERALDEIEGRGRGRQQSLAGQALPAPGTVNFAGVIHLHGRLADTVVGVDATPLVLTSAEYGEAYMRSGWASRFLFDLVRCRALVLVGYSASDAPVRYFLNVLEADRGRFSDLQAVYALDAVDGDATQADDRWAAVAVHPLPYRRALPSAADRHEVLWRDLGRLADLVDRPKPWRRGRAEDILSKPFEDASPAILNEIAWLIGNKKDLWDIAIMHIADPHWFDHFTELKLWDDADAAWVLAAWCALNWSDVTRLDAAISWHERFKDAFGQALETRLNNVPRPPPLFARAWRLLARDSHPPQESLVQAYLISGRIINQSINIPTFFS
jgi:SIR2-like domain